MNRNLHPAIKLRQRMYICIELDYSTKDRVMGDNTSIADNLKDKVGKLINLHRRVREDNIELQKKVASLTAELDQKSKSSQSLDKEEIKSKINELVREIDQCIALLNK